VFKVSAFRLNTCVQMCAALSGCHINNTWVKFTITSRWERRYIVKAVHMVDNSDSTSHSIISCLGREILVQINHILTKFCPWKLGVLVIMTHRVVLLHIYNTWPIEDNIVMYSCAYYNADEKIARSLMKTVVLNAPVNKLLWVPLLQTSK